MEYPAGGHDTIFLALEAVAQAQVTSRNEAAQVMERYLDEQGVIQFLLMSLQRGEDGVFNWRFNLRAMRDNYAAVRGAPDTAGPFTGPVLFVKGGDSNYILPGHREQVLALFPAAEMQVMPGCGHWLHAEQPEQFNSIVGRFLDQHAEGQ